MELRSHQQKAIELSDQSIAKGNKRIMLAAPCSFGKTRVAIALLDRAVRNGQRGIFLCDRIKLVQQSVKEFVNQGIDFGVVQGYDNPLSKWHSKIQIVSVQTLARRRLWPQADLIIVDEAHTHYKTITRMMRYYPNAIFIGLSATPFAKGLGEFYQDLIVPTTSNTLMDLGYLSKVKYFGGRTTDLKGIKRKALSTGGTDYDPKELSSRIEKDVRLAGDIIENWKRHGENSQTIAFTPSINHSKTLVRMFNEAGIPAEHIDGYMEDRERQLIYQAHDEGKFKILSCSRLLNTGYDAPSVRCMIDAYPTKSLITYVQRVGRILRIHPSKDYAIVLDHAGNVARNGFAEDVVPSELDNGEKRYNERNQTKEPKEPETQNCPECYQIMQIPRCACGYEIPKAKLIKTDNQILKELARKNRETDKEVKAIWYGNLLRYARAKRYKEGWAKHKYREKFGVWPNAIKPNMNHSIIEDVQNFITYQNIRRAKGAAKYHQQAG